MSEMKQTEVLGKAKHGKTGGMLDHFFQVSERGTTVKREVKAGVSVFFISVCALFMNIQIVMEAFADNIPYCGLYLGSTLVAFAGTLLVGILCNLPLVQTASLSMSTVMISILGAGNGLTYANLMAVTFVSAVVYLLVMIIPRLRSFVFHMIPDGVRSALPVAMGLYIASVALEKMGITDGTALGTLTNDALGGAALAPYMRLCVAAGLIGFVLVLFHKKRKGNTPVFTGFLTSTLIFFLIAAVVGGIAFTYVYTQNRIWVGVNPDPLGEMYTIGLGIKELQIGTLFKTGFDFTAYAEAGGSVVWLFVRSVLLFLFLGMYESEASVLGADANGSILETGKYEKTAGRFLLANAITNVLAPIVGSAPVSIGKQSAVATTDGGKTGLASVVCAIGYLISLFTWIPFVIFATYTKSVPEYGHAGFVFPNVIYASFQIADAVMLVMGLMMLKELKKIKNMEGLEILSFGITVVMTVFTQNIAYGVAAGALVSMLQILFSLKKDAILAEKPSQYVMAVLAAILLTASLFTVKTEADSGQAAVTSDGEAKTEASKSEGDAEGSGENSAGFVFDDSTGAFTFTGSAGVEYYTVWVYSVDSEGAESESYVAASSRLTGEGEITGNVDISTLAFGNYNVKLMTFNESGTNPDPIVNGITVTGKLSVPEFKYTQDGTQVTVTLFSDTLTTYNEKEMFTDIDIQIYDEEGNVINTETITKADLTSTQMGPMTNYSCEKVLELEAGTYQISLIGKGDGELAEASDESEKLSLSVKDKVQSEGMTSGYIEQEGGFPG